MWKKVLYGLRNKYIVTLLFFVVWLLLFDQNNFLIRYKYRVKLNELEIDRNFYKKEIERTRMELEEITTNPKTLEKFAREKYFMKRDNEEIFVFTTK